MSVWSQKVEACEDVGIGIWFFQMSESVHEISHNYVFVTISKGKANAWSYFVVLFT